MCFIQALELEVYLQNLLMLDKLHHILKLQCLVNCQCLCLTDELKGRMTMQVDSFHDPFALFIVGSPYSVYFDYSSSEVNYGNHKKSFCKNVLRFCRNFLDAIVLYMSGILTAKLILTSKSWECLVHPASFRCILKDMPSIRSHSDFKIK